MAVSVKKVYSRAHSQVWDVTSTADGDTTATITHGRNKAPDMVFITNRIIGTEIWTLFSKSKTTVVLSKPGVAVGGGDPNVQMTCLLRWSERSGA